MNPLHFIFQWKVPVIIKNGGLGLLPPFVGLSTDKKSNNPHEKVILKYLTLLVQYHTVESNNIVLSHSKS